LAIGLVKITPQLRSFWSISKIARVDLPVFMAEARDFHRIVSIPPQ
jgi:hypothetical protein